MKLKSRKPIKGLSRLSDAELSLAPEKEDDPAFHGAGAVITDRQAEAAAKCLRMRIPFALFASKTDSDFSFYASLDKSSPKKFAEEDDIFEEEEEEENIQSRTSWKEKVAPEIFAINFFNDERSNTVISNDLSASDILCLPEGGTDNDIPDSVTASAISTSKMVYTGQVLSVAALLKERNKGKVVLSRVISLPSEKSPVEVAREYFGLNPMTFRALFYHPDTGAWIVATPELLISYDWTTSDFHTMALAGTRPAGTEGPWDRKNRCEHQYVVEFIRDKVLATGIPVRMPAAPWVINAGKVDHLCTPMAARSHLSPSDLSELTSRLSPTPAVAGYPATFALDTISSLELHDRHCYGGWLGVIRNNSLRFYVNLRCALASPVKDAEGTAPAGYLYNVYTGGGILAQSNPEMEWEETRLKSLALCHIISPSFGADRDPGAE